MHSFYCRFILLFGNIGSGFNVIKIIKIRFEIFLDLVLNSDDWIIKIFFCDILWRNRLWSWWRFLSLLLCLRLFLRLVSFFLFFRGLLIRLALCILHFRLWLFLGIFIYLFRIWLSVLVLPFIIIYLFIVEWCGLWLFLFAIFLFRVSKELIVMFFDFLMEFKLSFYIIELLEFDFSFIISVFLI